MEGAELPSSALLAEERDLVAAVIVEVDQMALPAPRAPGGDSAALSAAQLDHTRIVAPAAVANK